MSAPLLSDFLDTLVAELATPGGAVDNACQAAFNCSPLIVRGSWFGDDKVLSERNAPFICVYPTETPAEVELHRGAGAGAAPRTFELSVAVGVRIDYPVEPPPELDAHNPSPVIYQAGGESAAEQFAYTVINAASERFSACGYIPSECRLDYSASLAWPLVVYDFSLSFATSRRLASGIL